MMYILIQAYTSHNSILVGLKKRVYREEKKSVPGKELKHLIQ